MDLNNRVDRMVCMVKKYTDAKFPDTLTNEVIERKTISRDPCSVYSIYKQLLNLPEDTTDWHAIEAVIEWVGGTDWWGGDHYETMFLAYMAKRSLR